MPVRSPWVSDETWAAVDPTKARLSRGQRRRVVLLVAVALVAALVPLLAAVSGLTQPHLGIWPDSVAIDRASHSYTVEWRVDNNNWFSETVTGLAAREHATSITTASPANLAIPAGDRRTLTVRFHVDDCAAPSPSGVLLAVRLSRPWGTQTVDVWAPQVDGIDSPQEQNVFLNGAAALACGRAD